MSAKPTPGEWKTVRGVKKHREAIFIKSSTGEFVAKVYGHEGQPVEANAAMLAAAPNLLSSLKSLVSHMTSIDSMITREEEPFIEAARAAIAKAEECN